MPRTEPVRRHHRARVIARRTRIVRACMTMPGDDPYYRRNGRGDGIFAKFNLVCSCPMCRERKYRDAPRQKTWDDD